MELLTVYEAAQLLRVSPITVRRYIDNGRLGAVRVGKGVRVRKESLDEFVRPVEGKASRPRPEGLRGRPTSADDPLWRIVGIAESTEPTDASRKHEYLAEAPAPREG